MSGSAHSGSEMKRQPQSWARWPWTKWLAWAPLVLFIVLTIVLRPVAQIVPSPPLLQTILGAIFVTSSHIVIAFLAAKAFLRTGQATLLWFGTGAVMISLVGLSVWIPPSNARVTFSIGGTFLASAVEALAIVFWQTRPTPDVNKKRLLRLSGSYSGGFVIMALVYLLSLYSIIPPFFSPQTGNTMVKQATAFSTAAFFSVAGAYVLGKFFELRSTFLYWFSLGLLMEGFGFIVSGLVIIPGTILSWISRSALYLGGFYWLIAALTAIREARTQRVPAAEVIANFFRQTRETYERAADSATAAVGVSRSGMTVGKRLGLAIPLVMLTAALAVRGANTGFVYITRLSCFQRSTSYSWD